MKTVADIDQSMADAENEFKKILQKVSSPDKKFLIMKIGNSLKISYSSVNSYFNGTGKNLKSALSILEELKKVLNENKP